MTEKELSSNSDWLLVENEKDDLEILQINFEKLEKNLVEEKEKAVKLEKKSVFLENELKEMNKKIEKINFDNESKFKEIEQNFQKLIEENVRKDEKINFLKEEILKKKEPEKTTVKAEPQQTQELFTPVSKPQQIITLDLSFKQDPNDPQKWIITNDGVGSSNIKTHQKTMQVAVNFVGIRNKWKEIEYSKCCDNKCINTNKPVGNCVTGNGFVNIIDDENIEYINCLEGKDGKNVSAYVYAEKTFKKPQNCFKNSLLYYFEIKCKFEGELNNDGKYMSIGLKNSSTNKSIRFSAKYERVFNEKNESFKLDNTSWNSNDIFGCGLVCPPANKLDEYPYVFFIKNGKQIGKAVLLKENFKSYKPYVRLESCSIEANFGNDLDSKPFNYDISKHEIHKEFY
ncbi:unnamed protein product [Meloidogyne enterolobii]|uniref:Uncharacterized protein n=1 Tax=Meloidogyne enterolobii TaxID=390850 RepID=A0ACB0YM40_MELEN